MAKIKKIEIEGFLNQGNFKWELDPVVNILGGKNGSGKTSILMLCHALLCDREIDDSLNRTLMRVFNKATLTLDNGYVLHWSKDTTDCDIHSPKAEIRSYLITQMMDSSEIDILIDQQIDQNRKHPSNHQFSETLERFLMNYDKPYSSDFIFSRNGHSVKWKHFSMGEKRIFLLLLTVYNMRSEPSILLLDSPELCMHIDWQEILIKELHAINPNMQIIAATHAPCIITGWMDKVREVSQLVI